MIRVGRKVMVRIRAVVGVRVGIKDGVRVRLKLGLGLGFGSREGPSLLRLHIIYYFRLYSIIIENHYFRIISSERRQQWRLGYLGFQFPLWLQVVCLAGCSLCVRCERRLPFHASEHRESHYHLFKLCFKPVDKCKYPAFTRLPALLRSPVTPKGNIWVFNN